MEMYTTEAIPTTDSPPVAKAWAVWTRRHDDPDAAVAGLKEKAAEGGADAIIGLRILFNSYESGRWYTDWAAYGTAIKRSGTRTATPFASRG
ncbi:heavy metal-binding domain-containing protein [Streptomyces lunaelactis]|uniref:heavy metal-binding domain-containing protein n=1 Tax=Streptomyces lunaelactis TaxID=1535768 RepID=UPI001585971C|nr:heavy metal-binding domain-containing protein [Streptomyces lunaelactis]NUK09500.1 heavy metal-binding domain-containing protein [Streptomyces lunaelactis]NUK73377.1 heavy metal-binding domain-containing protein [Streptomyces lunaelactis]NUL10916.1 heavy metal-binding domain-containing protein [Streptomyces lunaelactis]NUL24508.1 heavy metal-binding domain-containing protein [Streptomyces lunaelactis]